MGSAMGVVHPTRGRQVFKGLVAQSSFLDQVLTVTCVHGDLWVFNGRFRPISPWGIKIHVTPQVSHPYEPYEMTAKNVTRFPGSGRALVWAFSMQFQPREGDIRFSSASNAFCSCAEMVGGNGCRPLFNEFPPPSVAKSGGHKS